LHYTYHLLISINSLAKFSSSLYEKLSEAPRPSLCLVLSIKSPNSLLSILYFCAIELTCDLSFEFAPFVFSLYVLFFLLLFSNFLSSSSGNGAGDEV